MSTDTSLASLVLRVPTGIIFMAHGSQKLFGAFGGYGLEATGQFFEDSLGMSPGILFALLAGLVEFFGGLALVLGLLTRPAALAVTFMLGVALTVHTANGFFWTNGGIEYPLLWALTAFGIFLRGGDRFSLDARLGLRI